MANNIRCCQMGGKKSFLEQKQSKGHQSEIGRRPVDKSALYGRTTRQRFKDIEVQQQSWTSELNNNIRRDAYQNNKMRTQ